MSDTRLCTNCSRGPQPVEEFRSAQDPNVLVKQCRKCREKGAKQKAKENTREKHKERCRDQKYYEAYRERKRAEDEEAYLKHRAELMKKWREKNKDHLRLWRTTNLGYRLRPIKQQAALKKIAFELADTECEAMMQSACFYCGYLDLATTLNGIDRMNNNTIYTASNCVPCCGTCNFMKCALDARTFVERCGHVSAHNGGPGAPCNSWYTYHGSSYTAYKSRAAKKSLEFALTQQEFDALTEEGDCAYCGRGSSRDHTNGIDRLDNSRGYTVDNCVSCCADCNYMKRDVGATVFVDKCRAVAARTHTIPEMPRCLHPLGKRAIPASAPASAPAPAPAPAPILAPVSA